MEGCGAGDGTDSAENRECRSCSFSLSSTSLLWRRSRSCWLKFHRSNFCLVFWTSAYCAETSGRRPRTLTAVSARGLGGAGVAGSFTLSHPSVRTECTPFDLTRTLFDFLSRALDCASALGRIRRLHTLHLLMAACQTSIIPTTAPPAPAFLHEHGDRISRARCSRLRVLYSSDTHSRTHRCSR